MTASVSNNANFVPRPFHQTGRNHFGGIMFPNQWTPKYRPTLSPGVTAMSIGRCGEIASFDRSSRSERSFIAHSQNKVGGTEDIAEHRTSVFVVGAGNANT
jgi:hypothetical protein